ncbi:hypothetical protein tb265_25730 [Gemmatimonadetes bacterium T265]|nr:hypothetical protein tb265_25730 [Gemmatimonadetes bacterium T265]
MGRGWGAAGAAAWIAPWTPGGDALVVVAALAAAVLLLHSPPFPRDIAEFLAMRVTMRNTLTVAFVVAWATTVLSLVGAYDLTRAADARELLANTVAGCAVAALPVLLLVPDHGRWPAVAPGLLFLVGATAGVLACRGATYVARRLHRPEVRVVIAGTGPRARALWAQLRADPTVTYRLLAVADTPDALVAQQEFPRAFSDRAGSVPGVAVGRFDEYLMHAVVDEVFVALPHRSHFSEVHEVLRCCERAGIRAHHLADAFAPVIARPRVSSSGRFPAVSLDVTPDESRLVLKRVVDVLGALAGLVLLSPLLLAIAAAVWVTSPGPVLFAQERYGYRKRRFRMLKFRTMVADAEQRQAALEGQNEARGPVFKIAQDPRVTRVGALLRRTSLDELPQLWNVLRGDMSLVGPRPLPVRDVQRFDAPWLMRRFSVRPGLTCLWQVSGRSDVGFDEWVALDLRYIDEWSFGLDCRILLQTVPAVLSGRGAR